MLDDFFESGRKNDGLLAEGLDRIKQDNDVVGGVESLGKAFVRSTVPILYRERAGPRHLATDGQYGSKGMTQCD
jgi:hypothetical protein